MKGHGFWRKKEIHYQRLLLLKPNFTTEIEFNEKHQVLKSKTKNIIKMNERDKQCQALSRFLF